MGYSLSLSTSLLAISWALKCVHNTKFKTILSDSGILLYKQTIALHQQVSATLNKLINLELLKVNKPLQQIWNHDVLNFSKSKGNRLFAVEKIKGRGSSFFPFLVSF